MADKHPYSPGGAGGVAAAISQLRKSFPKTVDAETLKKLSIAPSNESYIINILRYVGAIDPDGNKTDKGAAVFSKSDDEFKEAFGEMVKTAYSDLFDVYGEAAWTQSLDKLKGYFRTADQTSELVGRHQANTFLTLASFAGHGEPTVASPPKTSTKVKGTKATKVKLTDITPAASQKPPGPSQPHRDFGLTVRIEVNLPAQGDQDTYDKIFRSIRENLFPDAK